MTGFPSIDKPWQKYYKQEDLEAPLPQCKFSDYVWDINKLNLDEYALEYLGTKITYGSFFHQIEQTAKGLLSIGVKQGDIVTVFSINTPETLFTVFALNKIGAIPCMEYVTESEKEAIEAVLNCKSSVVVILDILMSRFCGIGAHPSVEHVVVLPLARSLPAVKKIAFRLKAKVVHCAKEISYTRLIESGTHTAD